MTGLTKQETIRALISRKPVYFNRQGTIFKVEWLAEYFSPESGTLVLSSHRYASQVNSKFMLRKDLISYIAAHFNSSDNEQPSILFTLHP